MEPFYLVDNTSRVDDLIYRKPSRSLERRIMYHYDALGDDRFQEFCQALISANFPTAQCLPAGQPDGGRDAFNFRHAYSHRNRRQADKELIVFQVKFVKNPANSKTEREMILEVVKKERAKVERLKKSGLSKYVLITNLQGTAHLGDGSIDKVNELLSSELGVEAYCWWRDDLDRRLDGHPAIKWSYPDILKATDLLEHLVRGQLGENEERRKSAIRAYMTAQYDDDQELKFKQTDLRSTMTDLFVDLPMRRTQQSASVTDGHSRRYWQRVHRSGEGVYTDYYLGYQEEGISSAEFLIGRNSPKPTRIVIEGAPGQGKSTVTQYVCQVLRMHLLNKEDALRNVPASFRNLPAQIPFRIDLRDLAKWMSGIDPFKPKPTVLDAEETKSLEGFVAAQVRSASGGHTFNVSDLTAVARVSNMFLALDGFDEVADVTLRQQLVDEITKGVNRLVGAGETSMTTVVTSRPAAFAKSVVFPRESWAYYELLPLDRRQIDDYTTKWTKAKGLKAGEEAQLRKILELKLKEAHTQYLSKNPMQLTILLSLVHNRGPSLPEKRTAMYDSYMDMFFSRESEKSDVVRDNRDLLIDIHRYLAWKLQTAAEAGDSGSIEHSALRTALFEYLDKEGEDTSIVDALFNGIIERVGALVSRVQETYEFEVQPLREYFAARHLYETAPYPSDDGAFNGDKFERFKALAVNPYWLNVARFYGGCFNKGELLTLSNEITELAKGPPYEATSHPRSVAMMLLSDWVFSAYQPAVKQVISFVGEYPAFRLLLANAEQSGSSLWSNLPERSGRADFLDILWAIALKSSCMDERLAAANAISQNSSVADRLTRWGKAKPVLSHPNWVELGSNLDLFHHPEEVYTLCKELSEEMIDRVILCEQFSWLDGSKYEEQARTKILQRSTYSPLVREVTDGSRLGKIAAMCSSYQYEFAFSGDNAPLRMSIERRFRAMRPGSLVSDDVDDIGLTKEENEAFKAYNEFLETNTSVLSTSLLPWTELVEAMRRAWGDAPAIDRISFIAAGIKSKDVDGIAEPLSKTPDLVGSARYARLKSGAPRWWQETIEGAENSSELVRILKVLSWWATPNTLLRLASILDGALQSLTSDEWKSLTRHFQTIQLSNNGDLRAVGKGKSHITRDMSARLKIFIARRLPPEEQYAVALDLMKEHSNLENVERMFIASCIFRDKMNASQWKTAVNITEELYSKGCNVPIGMNWKTALPERIALQVCSQPEKYPLRLLALADGSLRSAAGAKAPRLLEVARQSNWFSN